MHVLLRATPSRVSLTSRFRFISRTPFRSFCSGRPKPEQPLEIKPNTLESFQSDVPKTTEPILESKASDNNETQNKETIDKSEKSEDESNSKSTGYLSKGIKDSILKDIQDTVYRQTRNLGILRSYLRMIGIILAVIATGSFIFRKQIQEFLGKQTAAVTTLTITDPEVQGNVHELAKAVVNELLSHQNTKAVAVEFVRGILEDPNTSRYVVQLANGVILDAHFQATALQLAQGIVKGIIADPATTDQVTDLVIRVSQKQETHDALKELFIRLFNDPYMNAELQKMLTAALASETVTNQTAVLANDTVQYLMKDPAINDLARAFINSTLSTESVQEAAGNAVWEALKIAFTPSVLASNYNSNRPNGQEEKKTNGDSTPTNGDHHPTQSTEEPQEPLVDAGI